MKSEDADDNLEVLSNFPYKCLEGKRPDQKLCALLILNEFHCITKTIVSETYTQTWHQIILICREGDSSLLQCLVLVF